MNDEIAKIESLIDLLTKKIHRYKKELFLTSDPDVKWKCDQTIEESEKERDKLYKEKELLEKRSFNFRESIHQQIQPWRFDMEGLIALCHENITVKSKGVIGVAVNSGDDNFLKNFRERLVHELNLKPISKPSRLYPLGDPNLENEQLWKDLKYLKNDLLHKNVFIIVPVRTKDISEVNLFWDNLCQEFEEQINHRLIVVFGGNSTEKFNCPFPEKLNLIHLPPLEKSYIGQWIAIFRPYLTTWPEEVFGIWQERMLKRCKHTEETVKISIFAEIEDAIDILRDCNYHHETFLEHLY